MRKIVLVLLILGVVLIAGCSNEQPVVKNTPVVVGESDSLVVPSGEVYTVVIENSQFMPTNLQVKAGDTIEWVNKDYMEDHRVDELDYDVDNQLEADRTGGERGVRHTVTFENGDVDADLPPGATVNSVMMQKGLFNYFCQYHPGMQATVTVY